MPHLIPSFALENHGSIYLIRPMHPDVTDWLHEYTDGQWFGGALVVEPRFVFDIVVGLNMAGYE